MKLTSTVIKSGASSSGEGARTDIGRSSKMMSGLLAQGFMQLVAADIDGIDALCSMLEQDLAKIRR